MNKVCIALGVSIRLYLFYSGTNISIRYLDSPYTSAQTYKEGLSYLSNNLSPYFEGSPVHAPPLLLLFSSLLPPAAHFPVLLLVELLSLLFLYKFSKVIPIQNIYSVLFYYLNPFSIYMCISLSVSVLVNALIILFLYYTQNRRRIRAAYTLSWLWYIDPNTGILSSLWYFQHCTLRMYLHSGFMLGLLVLASNILAGDSWVFAI